MPRRVFQLLWLTAALSAALLLLVNATWGPINQDEGWYLYAARSFAREGLMPYRDFAFTQGPLMVFAYGAFDRLSGGPGLLEGRLFTACLGAATFLLAASLAGALTIDPLRRRARLLAFTLVSVNAVHSYFVTLPKTYALALVLLLAGWRALAATPTAARRATLAALAGYLLALAAGVRLSSGVCLAPAGLYLLSQRKDWGDRPWIAFGITGLLGLLLPYGIFLWLCPDQLRFGLLEYHAQREGGGPLTALLLKAGSLSRFVQTYFVVVATLLAAWVAAWFGQRPSCAPAGAAGRLRFAVLGGFLLLTLVHLAAPFPYDDYQTVAAPLLAALAAVWLAEAVIGPPPAEGCGGTGIRMIRGNLLSAAVLLACLLSAASSPLVQDWFVFGRDRVWWPIKAESDLARLRAAASAVNDAFGEDRDSPLLTQDLVVAVEAGRRVPRGLEMGPFSLYPAMDRGRADFLGVVNTATLEEMLRAPNLPVAAFTRWSWSIDCPAVRPLPAAERARLAGLAEERRPLFREIPRIGQGHETLRIVRFPQPENDLPPPNPG